MSPVKSEARKMVKEKMPSLLVDGEMQASIAFNNELMKENYPFCFLLEICCLEQH